MALLVAAVAAGGRAARAVAAGPWEKGVFQGRIAWSADGNHNDPDDWTASPMALGIFAECGLKDRLVHFDYNCILPNTYPEWEKIHAASVLGAVECYGYDPSRFHDCRKDLDGALARIAKAIDESSADNPLYFIIAGPMEVPYRGIQKSDPEKRKHVYCISHSRWNDGFARGYTFANTKRSVIPSGVRWVQIRDQNRLLCFTPWTTFGHDYRVGRHSEMAKADDWRPYLWMRDSSDPRLQFQWERLRVSTRPDPSDSGMAYFLVSGDEECDPQKLKKLLADHVCPTPVAFRSQVRLEAENFLHLDGYELEDRNDKHASHALNVGLTGGTGKIGTPFDQPYIAENGRYDIDIQYLDEPGRRSTFSLLLNGIVQGASWESNPAGAGWMTHTIANVEVRAGDEVAVEAQGASGRIDFVQLNKRSR